MANRFDTHEVTNQSVPLAGYDAYSSNPALVAAVGRYDGAHAGDELVELGTFAGSQQAQEWARQANENKPVLHTHDRYGNRIDVVDYHPSYHRLMEAAVDRGVHGVCWVDERPGAHVVRAAKMLTWYGMEAGHCCPISMTTSIVPALRHQGELADQLEPKLVARTYDGSNTPIESKSAITAGMAMTEKQGGSDVRANTTSARPVGAGGPGAEYELTGHKWFCSAPMSDGFLMLAQAPGGLSCFWTQRWRPDGTRNPIRIQRLKDKLGDHSNASSEVELADVWAVLVGEEGRGVATIIEMVNSTRLDCALGAASIMRSGVAQATWHTHRRAAFGKVLDQQPLMENVLADLCIESEAATAIAMRLAATFDAAPDDPGEELLQRLLTPVAKYWTTKRAPVHAAESLECLGGLGYIEDSEMPRIFRQSPLNGVWEGSGNVIALDALRAMARSPESIEAFMTELDLAAGADRRLDAAIAGVRKELGDTDDIELRARGVLEAMALAMQGSLLVRQGPPEVADAFCASRLEGDSGRAFGTLRSGLDLGAIIDRNRPRPL